MSQLYVIVLVIIVTALMAVAIYRTSRVKTKADYLVAGRSLPALVLVLTLLTSWIGAGSLFAGAENAYRNGFAALWLPAGGWLGLLLIYFIAPRARRFAQFTLPDLLEARYNQTARVLGTIAILFAYVGITSYQFKGGGNVLHLIFPDTVTPELGTFLIAAFVIVTTALAGMSSVAYMDVAIGSLVTVICVIAAPMLLVKAGGWSGLHAALPPTHFQFLGNLTLVRGLEFLVPTMLLMLGNQVMYQKFFSAKSEKDARVSVIGWIFGTIILETLIVSIAVIGSALYPTGEVARQPYARIHGRCAPRRGLRQGHLHGFELSLLPGYQPC
jgi:SSS family solute:Na+ symporter